MDQPPKDFNSSEAGYLVRVLTRLETAITTIANTILPLTGKGTLTASSIVAIPDKGNYFEMSGSGTIASFTGTTKVGRVITIRFLSSVDLTHGGPLLLLGGWSRTTFANDVIQFVCIADNQWLEINYKYFLGNIGGQFRLAANLTLPTAGATVAGVMSVKVDQYASYVTDTYTVPCKGKYRVYLQMRFTTGTVASEGPFIIVNGVNLAIGIALNAAGFPIASVMVEQVFNKGDTIKFGFFTSVAGLIVDSAPTSTYGLISKIDY